MEANRQVLTQFMSQIPEDYPDRAEFRAVALRWIRQQELEIDNLQFNPVAMALDAAVDIDAVQFVADFAGQLQSASPGHVIILSIAEQDGLQALHAWNIASRQIPDGPGAS
jgi:hypothetical protein